MAFYQILILAIVQGLTEFLPVSSSGHLILIPEFLKWPDQGLEIDVAVHLGTLGAVFLYFWRDVLKMFFGFLRLLQGKVEEGGRRALFLIIATLPAVISGALLSQYGMHHFRSLWVIGSTTLGYGLLLFVADQSGAQIYRLKDMTTIKAFFMGIAQAFSLIPGTSRAGICMSMGRFLGFTRREAARFSFLMSIPTILAAATHTGVKMSLEGRFLQNLTPILWGVGVSLISGLIAINFMMKWLQRSNFTPFVMYRISLGLLILSWAYFRG